MEQSQVGWITSGKEEIISLNDSRGDCDHKYMELRPEDGVRLLAMLDNNQGHSFGSFQLYWEGDYESPYQSYLGNFGSMKDTEDLNFDDYGDLRLSSNDAFLWNHEHQCYEEVLCDMEDISFDFMHVELFEDQKTLYSDSWNWTKEAEDVERRVTEKKEYLWQWEGQELILKRECILEIFDDMVNIRVQEGNGVKILSNHKVTRKKWEENKEILRPFYEQFYKGLTPEGTYELKQQVKSKRKYISGELLNKIARALENQEELEDIKLLSTGRILTNEEICSLAREYMEIRVDLAEAVYLGTYTMLEADMDNDGILDLLAEKYWGGSGGFTDCILYQGQKDGGYVRTSSTPQLLNDYVCISYDGKNYVCGTTFNYRRKKFSGVSLYYYEEGQLAEEKYVELVLDSYQVQVLSGAEEQWTAFAKKTAAESMKFREQIEDYEIVIGSAEQEIATEKGNHYRCDLNNDGEMEEYEKRIWLTSSMASEDHLSFSGDGEKLIRNMLRDEVNPAIMLWVEEENIIHVMYLTGLYDYEVAGYLAKGDKYEQVYRIQGKAKVRAEVSE